MWERSIFISVAIIAIFTTNHVNGSEAEKVLAKSFIYNCTKFKIDAKTTWDEVKNNPPNLSLIKLMLQKQQESPASFPMSDVETMVSSASYNSSLPLVIVLADWATAIDNPSVAELTTALTNLKNINVVVLDYQYLMFVDHMVATNNVRFIGDEFGKALAKLKARGVNRIHLIGHGMGAHIAGFSGKMYNTLTGTKISRISGLDPSGACFNAEPNNLKLAATDASFVDVIYTDSGVTGAVNLPGAVTFYPNGGDNQPGTFEFASRHTRAIQYFSESVANPTAFPAVPCDGIVKLNLGGCATATPKVNMGYWTPTTARGNYYLRTGSLPRYNLGDDGIKAEGDPLALLWGCIYNKKCVY